MIKAILTVRRRPDLDRDAFRRHYVEVHGPIVSELPGLRRYVQNPWHPGFDPGRPVRNLVAAEVLGGISELWFDDLAALEAAMLSPAWDAAGADLANFAVPDATTMNVVEEVVQLG